MNPPPRRELAGARRGAGEAYTLISRLLTVLDDRMTTAGHPYALITQEHRGTCPPYECSLRCQEYRALFVEGEAWLDDHEAPAQAAGVLARRRGR